VIISDNWRNKGLGSLLLGQLLQVGRDEHLSALTADVLPYNVGMHRLCRKFGFDLRQDPQSPSDPMQAEIRLKATERDSVLAHLQAGPLTPLEYRSDCYLIAIEESPGVVAG